MGRILYSDCYSREGNDAWLMDYISIERNEIGLQLNHQIKHNGWNGKIRENYCIDLDEYEIEEAQKKIDDYLERNCIEDYFKISLNNILR